MPPQQLALPFGINPDSSFAAYVAGQNAWVVAALRACAEAQGENFVYVYGVAGVGKTHVLNAACLAAHTAGLSSAYLPLAELREYGPEVLDGMDCLDLLCLDDLSSVGGDIDWERALFHLFNRLRDGGRRLIVAADTPPTTLGMRLPDLASRLAWGLSAQLQALDDEAQLTALRQRALALGMDLPAAVGTYLLNYSHREPAVLWQLLDRLDRATLAAQRKLTLPFLKAYLGFNPHPTSSIG